MHFPIGYPINRFAFLRSGKGPWLCRLGRLLAIRQIAPARRFNGRLDQARVFFLAAHDNLQHTWSNRAL